MFFSTGFLFSQSFRVSESSNNFTEIKDIYQKRLHDVSLEFKYFMHDKDTFDGVENDFDESTKKTIGENKYFILRFSAGGFYFLYLVNRENSKAIVFLFSNEWDDDIKRCSEIEINNALSLYKEL
jgi:hypothetical protein